MSCVVRAGSWNTPTFENGQASWVKSLVQRIERNCLVHTNVDSTFNPPMPLRSARENGLIAPFGILGTSNCSNSTE